jgi:hypothetical protein
VSLSMVRHYRKVGLRHRLLDNHRVLAFLTGGELDEGASPLLCPFVLGMLAVEPVPLGGSLPVLPCQREAILHAEAALH